MDSNGGSPRSILRVVTRLNIGGPARHVLILARGLTQFGYPTTLLTGSEDPHEGTLWTGESHLHRVPELGRPISIGRDLAARRRIAGFIAQEKPFIVHTHMAKAGAIARSAAIKARTPLTLHTFHGHVLTEYFNRLKNRAFTAVERRLARSTDALVSVSEKVRDDLLELGIGKPEQWHVVPVGLELEELVNSELAPLECRTSLGLPADGPAVGIVGRLVPVKNHALFVAAAAEVAKQKPDVTFVVAGDGELRAELESEARRRLGDRVIFLGWVEDLAALYRALDVVVLTSRNEGTPVALIEAGAAQVPAVATAVGGVPDVVMDGVTGLLTPEDPRAVAEAILSLLKDPARARRLGSRARSEYSKRYSSTRLLADMRDLYDSLLLDKGFTPPARP